MRGAARKGRLCVVCGSTYNANGPRQRTCGRACGATYWRSRRPVRAARVVYAPTCRGCAHPFTTTNPHRVNCDSCAGRKRTRPPFDCEVCGQHVVPGESGVHPQKHRYCSTRCKQRASHVRQRECGTTQEAKHRYRARKLGAFVAPVSRNAVFERDGWQCQLCRQPVVRHESVPHPLAPVIDHVLPLAAGGTHEPANVQTAHFACNCAKGSGTGPSGDQLRLAA